MALHEKDLKLLWARSAGLCAFLDCKENLVRFSQSMDGYFHIGEQAHMVARSIKGPRGTGLLAATAVDSYANHILLCPTCHTAIDKVEADYPVERLREFKDRHESWVAEVLHANLGQLSPSLKFYAELLNLIDDLLGWHEWNWLIDSAWRDMLPTEICERTPNVVAIQAKTIWPGTKPRLEKALRTVMERWVAFVHHFEGSARYGPHNGTEFLVFAWRQGGGSQERHVDEEANSAWSKKNGELLMAYVESLNDMVMSVRDDLDPGFRQKEGWFLITDSMGYRSGAEPTLWRPGGPPVEDTVE